MKHSQKAPALNRLKVKLNLEYNKHFFISICQKNLREANTRYVILASSAMAFFKLLSFDCSF